MEYSDYAAHGKLLPSSLGQAPVQNELEESYLSTSSFDQNPPHEQQVFKSQGIKQLLSQAPASGLTTT